MMKPNVVFVMADDMGWGDPGCYNSESQVPTPNIDRIAGEGARLTQVHAASAVCSPSRYALLTGRYAWRTRMKEGVLYGYCRHLIEPGQTTLGTFFKQLGYRTACIGKWHVGLDWTPRAGDDGNWGEGTIVRHRNTTGHRVDFGQPIKNGPTSVGFDYFFGTAACSTCNEPYVFIENDRATVMPEYCECPRRKRKVWRAPGWDDLSVDDVYVDKAIGFMEQHKDGADPFFLYLPLSAPHGPYWPPRELEERSGDGRRGDMVCWFDRSVGRIDEALKRWGLRDNTLLIVTSDNGSPANNVDDAKSFAILRENPKMSAEEMIEQGLINPYHRVSGPYRGYKTDIWDGGTRVPFIVRWPGRVVPGCVCDGVFCLMDMLPTMATLFQESPGKMSDVDGIARPNMLLGRPGDAPREELVTLSYTGVFALRKGPWKLIPDTLGSGGHRGITPGWRFYEPDTPGQLYNLQQDPHEQNNLWDQDHQDLVYKLRIHLQNVQNRNV